MRIMTWFAAVTLLWNVFVACDSGNRDEGTGLNQENGDQDVAGAGFGGAETSGGGGGSDGFTVGTIKKDTASSNDDTTGGSQNDATTGNNESDQKTGEDQDIVEGEQDIDDPVVWTGCVQIANCVVQCTTMDQSCVDQCTQGADPEAAQAFNELWTCAQANCVIGDPSMGDCMATQCGAQYTACISPG